MLNLIEKMLSKYAHKLARSCQTFSPFEANDELQTLQGQTLLLCREVLTPAKGETAYTDLEIKIQETLETTFKGAASFAAFLEAARLNLKTTVDLWFNDWIQTDNDF